jgi:hypothetical protein
LLRGDLFIVTSSQRLKITDSFFDLLRVERTACRHRLARMEQRVGTIRGLFDREAAAQRRVRSLRQAGAETVRRHDRALVSVGPDQYLVGAMRRVGEPVQVEIRAVVLPHLFDQLFAFRCQIAGRHAEIRPSGCLRVAPAVQSLRALGRRPHPMPAQHHDSLKPAARLLGHRFQREQRENGR